MCKLYKNNYDNKEAVVLYSSGTTGKAKGIILSHSAISLNADLIAEYMLLSDNDCLYMVKSLSHSSTLIGELLVGLKNQIKMLISPTINNPRAILENINKYGVTTICVNPSLLDLFSFTASMKKIEFNTLKTIYTSGAVAKERLLVKAHNVFPGVDILNVYGLSEAGPRVSAQRKNKNNIIGSVGHPMRDVNIAIIGADGSQLEKMNKGIIHVQTPCIFSGYISTKIPKKIFQNNWLNTGDIGYIDDDGNLFIVSRADNMISIGSHNVYPEELESEIMSITKITDCIIIPQKNEIQENKLICFYVAQENMYNKLREFCIMNFASYEIPSKFIKIDNIPTTPNGKKIRSANMYHL